VNADALGAAIVKEMKADLSDKLPPLASLAQRCSWLLANVHPPGRRSWRQHEVSSAIAAGTRANGRPFDPQTAGIPRRKYRISTRYLGQVLRGERENITVDMARCLAHFFLVTADFLLAQDESFPRLVATDILFARLRPHAVRHEASGAAADGRPAAEGEDDARIRRLVVLAARAGELTSEGLDYLDAQLTRLLEAESAPPPRDPGTTTRETPT
jgi:hypothetical protein